MFTGRLWVAGAAETRGLEQISDIPKPGIDKFNFFGIFSK
jgi:hypothetical protein